jgi:hypothetical protein
MLHDLLHDENPKLEDASEIKNKEICLMRHVSNGAIKLVDLKHGPQDLSLH